MNSLQSFILPVKGLKNGIHQFNFKLENDFFKAIDENSDINGSFDINLDFDKRDSMFILEFFIQGTRKASCDRCLEVIPVNINGDHKLYIKKGISEDEADVVYLEKWEDELNIAKYIYDYVLLSFPLMHVYDCDEDENPPCNFDMLDKWEDQLSSEDENENSGNNVWDALNDLNLEQ